MDTSLHAKNQGLVGKEGKTIPSIIRRTIFWDFQGMILIDYFGEVNVNQQYYADLLDRFNCKLKTKRPHLAKKRTPNHDNIPVQALAIATAKLLRLWYELVSHPIHSQDLAFCGCSKREEIA
ncbi:hypothetical protein Trydic_g11810 [Trypoxylus dichotomus]